MKPSEHMRLLRGLQKEILVIVRFKFWNFLYFSAKPSIVDGIDIPQEVSTLQGGPLLNEIFERGREKIRCVADAENCSIDYLKPLKFYAYSSVSDQQVVSLGTPHYFSTINLCMLFSSLLALQMLWKLWTDGLTPPHHWPSNTTVTPAISHL